MPRLKTPYNRHEALQKLIYGAMGVQGKTTQGIAAKWGKDPRTIGGKIKNPDRMTLGELRRLCGELGITADEIRGAIKF